MVAVYFDQVIEKQKHNITRGVKQQKKSLKIHLSYLGGQFKKK